MLKHCVVAQSIYSRSLWEGARSCAYRWHTYSATCTTWSMWLLTCVNYRCN